MFSYVNLSLTTCAGVALTAFAFITAIYFAFYHLILNIGLARAPFGRGRVSASTVQGLASTLSTQVTALLFSLLSWWALAAASANKATAPFAVVTLLLLFLIGGATGLAVSAVSSPGAPKQIAPATISKAMIIFMGIYLVVVVLYLMSDAKLSVQLLAVVAAALLVWAHIQLPRLLRHWTPAYYTVAALSLGGYFWRNHLAAHSAIMLLVSGLATLLVWSRGINKTVPPTSSGIYLMPNLLLSIGATCGILGMLWPSH